MFNKMKTLDLHKLAEQMFVFKQFHHKFLPVDHLFIKTQPGSINSLLGTVIKSIIFLLFLQY